MPTPPTTSKPTQTGQDWLPVADVQGPVVIRKDGALVGLLRLSPLNTDLLHDRELARISKGVAEAWNGERQGFQLFSIGRNIDLGGYKGELQSLAERAADPRRRAVLRMFLHETMRVMDGDIVERQHYMILTQEAGKDARAELLQRLQDMAARMALAGVRAEVQNEREIVKLYALYASPVMATLGDMTVQHFDMQIFKEGGGPDV